MEQNRQLSSMNEHSNTEALHPSQVGVPSSVGNFNGRMPSSVRQPSLFWGSSIPTPVDSQVVRGLGAHIYYAPAHPLPVPGSSGLPPTQVSPLGLPGSQGSDHTTPADPPMSDLYPPNVSGGHPAVSGFPGPFLGPPAGFGAHPAVSGSQRDFGIPSGSSFAGYGVGHPDLANAGALYGGQFRPPILPGGAHPGHSLAPPSGGSPCRGN